MHVTILYEGQSLLGEEHEFVPGAMMVGLPGREYTATQEHHGRSDECLSIKLAPQLAESIDSVWQAPRLRRYRS